MTRFLFVSPDSNTPTGGVKVIYKHVELLRKLGVDAHVMHFQRPYRCDWFENEASVVYFDEIRTTDMMMVPEIMTIFGTQLASIGMRYCMFVQNGYLVLPTAPLQEVFDCYRNATAILSISEDTSAFLGNVFPEFEHKIFRVKYSVDTERFKPRVKVNKCTYMPRKLPLHSANLVPWLARAFPDWTFQPIHDMNEAQVAEQLQSSRVFLAFSDFEGCPVPPIEAALSGNVVVGYPGWGGREYWDAPNFLDTPVGDMRAFVDRFRIAAATSLREDADSLLAPGIARLKVSYSLEAETALLREAVPFIERFAAAQAPFKPLEEPAEPVAVVARAELSGEAAVFRGSPASSPPRLRRMTMTPWTLDRSATPEQSRGAVHRAPWLVLTTPHVDKVTENFARQIAAGLAIHGRDARMIVVGPDLAERLSGIALADVAGVVTIGPLPLTISMDGTPLYRMLRCPVYYYILDTLIYDLLRMPVAAQFIADAWTDDRLVPMFAEKQFLNAWRAGTDPLMPPQTIYIPFAAFPDEAGQRLVLPVQQRLLVIGSIGTELHAGAMRPELMDTLTAANAMGLSANELARIEERLLAPGARGNVVIDLFDALGLGSRAALEPAVQAFVSAADSFVKRHRRVIAAESLRGVPVDFVGSGWQQEFDHEPSFRFMGNLPHASLTRLTSMYAALVNFDPNWEWGMHDRVFSALSVGVPVFTHANAATADEGLPADRVIGFAPNAPALAAPAHALLAAALPAREPALFVDWGNRMQRLLAASLVKEFAA